MQYMLPRLRGWGESMSRQAGGRVAGGGGIGTRGPGETKIETDRRRIRARMSKLRREIAGMATARATQRGQPRPQRRPERGDRRLHQRRQVQPAQPADRRRRARARTRCSPPWTRPCAGRARADGREYTLTDTVGFVRHLPHQLVDAFRSTLEEVAAADLLLHVVDGSDPDPLGQIQAVRTVLGEIDAAAVPGGHRRQQGRRHDRGRRPRAAAGAARARSGSRRAPAPGIDAAARADRRAGCRAPTSTSRCWCPTTGATWWRACTATARCSPRTHEAGGTRLTARVDGALAAALRGVRRRRSA